MELSNLRPAEGSKHSDNFRRGRGHGSGNGKTAGKGHKGQKARAGHGMRPGFEGGQMPLQRRVPKRGFNNIFAKEVTAVNVSALEVFEDGATVDAAALKEKGIIKTADNAVKVLGNGKLTKKLTVKAMGLTKMHKTVEMPDNAATRGMIQQVQHLVKVEEA